MTDNDVLDQYLSPLAGLHMDAPAEAVLARGDRRRHRRVITRWVVAGGGVVAAAVALSLVITGSPHSDGNGAQLAAFTLTDGPSGSSTLTLHKNAATRLDPEALRSALARRGIQAKVTVGSWCDTATEPAGLHQAVTVGHDPGGDPTLTIHPAGIPANAEMSIGYFGDRTVLALIDAGSPLTCSTIPRQAASRGQGQHEAIVLTNG